MRRRSAPAALRWVDPFVVGLLATVALASVLPARGAVATALDPVVFAAVAFLFFLYGVRLPTRDALTALRSWRLHSSVLAATYVAFPLLGVGAYLIARTVLPDDLARGVLFLAVLPSTVQSSITFTSLAKGNVAAAVVSASLSNLAGVALTPLLVVLLLDGALEVTGGSVVRIAVQLLMPFVLGQLLRRFLAPAVVSRPHLTRAADRGAVLLVVYSAFGEAVVGGIWRTVTVRDLLLVTAVVSIMLVIVLAMTAAAGRSLGLPREDRVVLLMCGSKKSLASGVPLGTVLLPAAALGTMLLPLMIFHQVQLIVGAAIARRLGRRADAAEQHRDPAAGPVEATTGGRA